jgi:hypothetical protein
MAIFIDSQSPIALKAIELDAKIHALEDCMNALKLNENLLIQDVMKYMRKLSNKQFKLITKKEKLFRYIRANNIRV